MKKQSKKEEPEMVEIVMDAELPPPPPSAPPAPQWSAEPKFLGDVALDYKPETDVAKLAWASEEGIRRVELPGWVFDKLKVFIRNG